jgi:hypothetical protein
MKPGLHECPSCTSQLVQPTEVRPLFDAGAWYLLLKCPNCSQERSGMFTIEQVDALEEALDQGLDAIVADLRRMTETNMADDIARFTAALHAGHVLPEDFSAHPNSLPPMAACSA